MGDIPSDHIKVRCQCGKKLAVPSSAVGRKARCPACKQTFVITEPRFAPAPDPEPVPLEGGGSVIDQLAQQEAGAGATPQMQKAECPMCRVAMAPGARICVSCGYDTKSGRTLTTSEQGARRSLRLPRLGGTFLLGCVLSAVGAVIGAVVWSAVAMGADRELGIIAWGVGLLAGCGMHLGYRQISQMAGCVAAGMAILSIMAAKVFLFVFLIYVMFTGDTQNIGGQRAFLIFQKTNEILDERKVWSEQERREQWESAVQEAQAHVEQLSDDEVRAKCQEYRDEQEEWAEMMNPDSVRSKCRRLAYHRGHLRSRQMGLSYYDEQRDAVHEEELARVEELSEHELDAALAELEAWEESDKWSDREYVRSMLIYEFIDKTIEQGDHDEDEDPYDVTPEKWQRLYQDAVAEADLLSPEEQPAKLRQLEAEREQRLAEMIEEEDDGEFEDEEEFPVEEETEGVFKEILAGFLRSMFRGLDILFFIFAIASAYRVGSYGFSKPGE